MEHSCPAKVFEEAKVTVPCEVRAFAEVGHVELKCKGEPVVTRNSVCTPGRPGAVSRFTVSQRLRVDIPLVFSAEAEVGEGHVDFDLNRGHEERGGCGKCGEREERDGRDDCGEARNDAQDDNGDDDQDDDQDDDRDDDAQEDRRNYYKYVPNGLNSRTRNN